MKPLVCANCKKAPARGSEGLDMDSEESLAAVLCNVCGPKFIGRMRKRREESRRKLMEDAKMWWTDWVKWLAKFGLSKEKDETWMRYTFEKWGKFWPYTTKLHDPWTAEFDRELTAYTLEHYPEPEDDTLN